MFFGVSTYGMPSLKVQTYNLLYAKVPHSPQEALDIAIESAKWIFGDSKVDEYPVRGVLCEEGRWKVRFLPPEALEQNENKGIELQLGMNTGKIRYWDLKE